MNANASHPLAQLSTAEATLIAGIDAATAKLDSLGTHTLDAVVDRLRNAARAATNRLSQAGAVIASMTEDVLACVLGVTTAMRREQTPVYQKHLAAGGSTASPWLIATIGSLILAALITLAILGETAQR